jgi:hypothetical protein
MEHTNQKKVKHKYLRPGAYPKGVDNELINLLNHIAK